MKKNPPIDSLPVEDVATIQTWIDFLEYAPSVVSMTICLSDGETLYTIEKSGSEIIEEETADEYLDRLVKEASPSWKGIDPRGGHRSLRRRHDE